jgi:Leucine-rich repeat (LRR) protein
LRLTGGDIERIAVVGQHLPGLHNDDVTFVNLTLSEVLFVPSQVFAVFPSITRADIRSGVNQIQPNAFKDSRSLTHLYLSNNILTAIPAVAFAGASNLRILFLDSNSISNIHQNAFSGLNHVVTLNLGNNQIRDFPPNVFRPLIRLQAVFLQLNQISRLDGNLFAYNQQMHQLSFEGNQIEAIDRRFLEKIPTARIFNFLRNDCVNLMFFFVTSEALEQGLSECFKRSLGSMNALNKKNDE